ncbi:MAG: hypothetical protein WCB15_26630 [Desulfobacterales bacterium]
MKICTDLLPLHANEHIAIKVYNGRGDTDSLTKALKQATAFFHIYQFRKFVIHFLLKRLGIGFCAYQEKIANFAFASVVDQFIEASQLIRTKNVKINAIGKAYMNLALTHQRHYPIFPYPKGNLRK